MDDSNDGVLAGTAASGVFTELERMLHSERFRKAPSLRHLLQHLVTKAADGQADQLKESLIGIDVFARGVDFDSRIDNIVRVQVHRLRKLLDAYYADEGKSDPLRIVIPKGSYIPQFLPVPEPPVVERLTTLATVVPAAALARKLPALPRFRLALLLIASFLAGGAAFSYLPRLTHAKPAPTNPQGLLSPPLSAIWKELLQPGSHNIVSFTNPAFLWADTSRSRLYFVYHGPLSAPAGTQVHLPPTDPYFDPKLLARTGPLFFSDSWTGTGEVMAIHKLTQLFAEAGAGFQVRRSRTLTFDDMRHANVIFIGSSWGNDMQDKLRLPDTPFSCCDPASPKTGMPEAIFNHDPQQGEQETYRLVSDPATRELTGSYGLFSVLPGVEPGRRVIISAGLTTHSTWAGIDFFSSVPGIEELMRKFQVSSPSELPPYFQAVVRTEIVKGEISNSTLAAVRAIDPKRLAR